MILKENYILSNGVGIPKLALGTWFISDDNVAQAIKDAVKIGYRHIDTAQAYKNEGGVGEGIRTCGIDRGELFVTTKLAAEVKSYKEAVSSIDGSLEKLGLDHIDMMIIHSPKPWAEFAGSAPYFEGNLEAWRALEEAYKAGKLRAYCLQLDLLPIPKTANPEHMKTNAAVDFVITEEDMTLLKNIKQIEDYGVFSRFPVFAGKTN